MVRICMRMDASVWALTAVLYAERHNKHRRMPFVCACLPAWTLCVSGQIARQGGGLRAYNYPIMVIGPEDNAGWCIVIGLRSSLLGSNAQVRFVPQLTPVVAQASRHCWLCCQGRRRCRQAR